MAESALQDIELDFAGKTWTLRPEFRTLVAIEAALEQPSRALGLKFLRMEASVGEIAATIFMLLRDRKDAPTRDEIGEAIMADGYDDVLMPIGTYLTRAIRGSKEHEKEALAKREKEAAAKSADENPSSAPLPAAQTTG